MSSRRSKNIKPAKRTRPAKTAREANARWGFCDRAGDLAAYTAEHFSADVDAGVIAVPARGCPRRFADDCTPHDVPLHYRSTRSTIVVDTTGERPRRWRRATREVCFDCRVWHWWRERREFADEHGDDVDPLGYHRHHNAV